MTRIEIQTRLQELDKEQFILSMKDHWGYRDFERDRILSREIRYLTKKLKEVEG